MNTDSPEKEQNAGAEIDCRVFYSNSEEAAKLMAISYIRSNINRSLPPLVRPSISFKSYLFGLILPIVLYAIVTVSAVAFVNVINIWPFIVGYAVVFLFTIKPFVILCVLLHQKYAPERIRRSCCFEPTCSNYMLQAIEKYGFWRGFAKGCRRLCRCHYPNGGIDIP